MKKRSRLTALLLALMMLVTSMPIGALADTVTIDVGTWNEWVSSAQQAATKQENATKTVTTTTTVTGTTDKVNRPAVEASLAAHAGTETSAAQSVSLPIAGKLVLNAYSGAGSYQWQVKVGSQWANIVGDNASAITLTYAKIRNAMSGSTAQVRCVMTLNGEAYVSETAQVSVDETVTYTAVETQSTLTVTSEQPVKRAFTAADAGIMTMAETGEVQQQYNIIINYQLENGETAAQSYIANIAEGSNHNATVTHPAVVGYVATQGTAAGWGNGLTYDADYVEINVQGITADIVVTVVYQPTNVDYTVIHYKQNVENDNYTEFDRETRSGLTKSTVPEVAKDYPGFFSLLYDKPEIAADGSTVVEVYYDRNYYLMNFNLGGGYGVEPIYARYGAAIGNVGTPTRAGYVFRGWKFGDQTIEHLPETMPADNITYTAVWEIGVPVNYTVVYWKENANDNGYSFWGQVTKTATAGTVVSGSNDIPNSITRTTVDGVEVDEKPYFTFNAARTETDVEVKGDGSTVVNVYYYRNTYSIYFYGISGPCAIEEHTHGTNCNSYLDCIKTEHTHGADCRKVLTCGARYHEHTDTCTGLTCTIPVHSEHTAECLICTKEVHESHNAECCVITSHTHSAECCTRKEHTHSANCLWGILCTQSEHTHGDGSCSCSETEHVHGGSSCTCGTEIHYHSEDQDCYADVIHQHDSNCYGFTCGQAAHTHSDSCYTYTCVGEEHTHTGSCYRPCTKLEHTHNNGCNQNRDDNVIYVVTAKYEQNIANQWPTADKFTNIKLNGWNIYKNKKTSNSTSESFAVSKRVTMTSDLCDTGDRLKHAYATTGGSEQHLYYMFESFDQVSSVSGDTRRKLGNVYYDSDSDYYQVVNSGATNWGQKPIEGMAPVSNGVKYEAGNTKVFLYYKRNRSNLSYHNVNGVVKTVSSIMYGQPLKDYKDSENKLLSAYVPPYPSTLERNAYEFAGWYTTPECYDGTEFNFNTAKMPNGDLTIYAKWAPIKHPVSFYLDYNEYDSGTSSITTTHPQQMVDHGALAATVAAPQNGDYVFVGWFYMEDGQEKAFDFASMPVTKNLQVYGKWSSNVLKEYTVYYKIQGTDTEIAAPTTGSGLAGHTKTFDAKGGTELYNLKPEGENYQEGYFPLVRSHSMTLDIAENANNSYTFWYVAKPAVPYKVYYVAETLKEGDTSTNTIERDGKTYHIIAATKNVDDNCKAVVTEKFEPVGGYMPDAYQKRLVVDGTEGAVNEIIFYYTVDSTHAYYKITHYTQSTDGVSWTEYASSQAQGDIGTTYTAEPMTIEGFTYDPNADGTVVSGVLTAGGLELKLYYTRNSYPYEVRYLEQYTGKTLAPVEGGTALYGKFVIEYAIEINNYTPVDPATQTLTIRKEDIPTQNIITFYYTENEATINYMVVGPDGCGTVDTASETVKVMNGTAKGSTAAASDGYRFVGWYADAACSEELSTEVRYTPSKAENEVWTDRTYYAKFEHNLTTLTITKSGMENIDAGQSFLFRVTSTGGVVLTIAINGNGSETIAGLTVGDTVTVTEIESWSWRYTGNTQTIRLEPSGNAVTITNTRDNPYWLDGDCYKKNVFGASTTAN